MKFNTSALQKTGLMVIPENNQIPNDFFSTPVTDRMQNRIWYCAYESNNYPIKSYELPKDARYLNEAEQLLMVGDVTSNSPYPYHNREFLSAWKGVVRSYTCLCPSCNPINYKLDPEPDNICPECGSGYIYPSLYLPYGCKTITDDDII